MYTTLIFDMDGLMIDSEGLYWAAGRELARRYGKTVSDDTLRDMMGRSPVESVHIYLRDVGLTDHSVETIHVEREAIVERLLPTVRPMPGLFEVLGEFRGRLRTGICTSAPGRFADIVLRALDLAPLFDAVQTSDGVTNGKPHPEIYLKAMARLDARPGQCIVLEDSHNGARAAKAAGAYTIAVPSPYTEAQDFGFVDHRAASLADAAAHIRTLLAG